MPKIALTQSFVDSLACQSSQNKCDYFDTKTSGLLVQVLISGRKTFYIRYQNGRGKTVQKKIADASVVKLQAAREIAVKHLTHVAMGIDPFESKAELKQVPKLEQFILDSYMPYVKTYKRSWDTDWSLLKNHVIPQFGKLYMDEVAKRDIIEGVLNFV